MTFEKDSKLQASSPHGQFDIDTLKVHYVFATDIQYKIPVAAETVTVNNPVVILEPAGTLATLTIKFPNISCNGQHLWFVSTAAVTALTITNATIVGTTPTALVANTPKKFVAYNNKWYSM